MLWRKVKRCLRAAFTAAYRVVTLLTTFTLRILGVSRFFVSSVGITNGAHHDFVKKLRGVFHIEVNSPEECDYTVVFCPIASRVGTDVEEALNKASGHKPTILVVMHHSFDPDHVVADSRSLVTKPNVHLTVDCLFYEGHLLKCKRNDAAWDEVKKYLRVSVFQIILRKVWDLIHLTIGFVIWCTEAVWSLIRTRLQ